jgi:uncharacterized membrane protein
MNETKIFLGAITGALFTGIFLSVISYYATINDHSSTGLGPVSSFWQLAILSGGIIGAIVGGASGAIIIGFQAGLIKAILIGFCFNLILVAAFYIATGGGWENSMRYTFYPLVIIGAINGAVVSFVAKL